MANTDSLSTDTSKPLSANSGSDAEALTQLNALHAQLSGLPLTPEVQAALAALGNIDPRNVDQIASVINQAEAANSTAQADRGSGMGNADGTYANGSSNSDSTFAQSGQKWTNWLSAGKTIAIASISYDRQDIFDAIRESHRKYSGKDERPAGETVATAKIVGKKFDTDQQSNSKGHESGRGKRLREHLQGQNVEDIINNERGHNKDFAAALQASDHDDVQAQRVGEMVFDAAHKKAGDEGQAPEEIKKLRAEYGKKFREARHFVHQNYDRPEPEAAQKLNFDSRRPDHSQLKDFGVAPNSGPENKIAASAPKSEASATQSIKLPPHQPRSPALRPTF